MNVLGTTRWLGWRLVTAFGLVVGAELYFAFDYLAYGDIEPYVFNPAVVWVLRLLVGAVTTGDLCRRSLWRLGALTIAATYTPGAAPVAMAWLRVGFRGEALEPEKLPLMVGMGLGYLVALAVVFACLMAPRHRSSHKNIEANA